MDILALSRRIPLLGFFGSSASDDDFADRLNYKYTVAILVIFAFIVTNKHFGHNQINCWVPALFSKNFEEYTNLVCWITNTYYIPFDKQIPSTEPERRSTELRYYQWVAYILLFLSLLFYLPRIIWRTMSLRSGVDIKDVIEASHDFKSVSKLEKNRKMMEYMIGTIDQYVDDPRRQNSNRNMNFVRRCIALMCFMFGKFLGNYLVILYLFVKMLYIANCVGQLFLISILLGRNYYIYGASIFRDIIQGKGYADSEYFPRVTMCKFQVRELGLKNFSHEYNVQCVLPINLFNQQIFTFLWFWYLILLVINTCALLIWIYRFIPINQYNYAIRRIKLLRIRLFENSKLPKESGKKSKSNKYPTTVISNELDNQSTKNSIFNTFNDKNNKLLFDNESSISQSYNNHYLIDQKSRYQNNYEENMFPNVPNSFNYGGSGRESVQFNVRNRIREKSLSNAAESVKSFRMPIITEYDTYMSASSFSVKNYKSFVYEYLEADGMFMLRMIGSNSGDFVCTQVLHNLWKLFLCKKFSCTEVKYEKNVFDDETNNRSSEDMNFNNSSDLFLNSFNTSDEDRQLESSYRSNSSSQSHPKKSSSTVSSNLFAKIFKDSKGKKLNKSKMSKPSKGQLSYNFARSSEADILKKTVNGSNYNNEIRRIQSIKRVTLARRSKPT